MKYCEHCNCVSNSNFCNRCGRKKLRDIREDDYCFITEIGAIYKDDFQIMIGEDVPCAFIPSGTGLNTHLGLPLENVRVYIPYLFYDRVSKLLKDKSKEKQEKLKRIIFENLDKFFIKDEKTKKKFKRKLKIQNNESVLDFLIKNIKECDDIIDAGKAPADSIHYVFIYNGKLIISINLLTFEIISV